jgi:hypothetical protein
MLAFLAPALAFLKRLNLSQIALIALAALCLFLKLSLASEQRHSAKLQGQVVKLTAELQRISTAKDEQRVETVKTIAKADAGNKAADKVADRIEAAPLPGNCKTPATIMGADL